MLYANYVLIELDEKEELTDFPSCVPSKYWSLIQTLVALARIDF